VGGVDYRALAAFRSALRRFLRASAERARAVGMSAQQHQLLLAIKGHAGADPPLMGELAEALQVSPHAAVGLANRAARAGLLRRITVSSDRRRVGLVLTARGERLLASVTEANRIEMIGLRGLMTRVSYGRKDSVVDRRSAGRRRAQAIASITTRKKSVRRRAGT
jgi:DNA-binding MarR family transcriptional regulator